MAFDVDTWWREKQTREEELHRERSREYFESREDIPDLEFLPPDCSVCGKPTEFDDGSFWCEICRITWPHNGYGSKAIREPEPAGRR